ncbi:cytochrome b [Methylobacterium sp. J-068]|uniref:cytochrome b n=1 Tax=Methylobacterium sp. J-068 TaxID=2836649 RepID=UPI001FB8BEF5|nr:cytochrome b [Methylobacterium sp. J-068]MCJ2034955.1 cytochrome b [Methylobacterium sp. J-068]
MIESARPAAPLRYTRVAIALHWLTALAVLGLIGIGLVMTHGDLTAIRRFQLYQWHKSVGITVLGLSLLRLGWRLSHRPPPLPAALPRRERGGAHLAHLLLYALTLGLPLVGWALVSASPFNLPTMLFGTVPWPHLPVLPEMANKAAVEAWLKDIHAWGAWFLIALLLLHVGAALRHHWVLRDDTLRRMLPRLPLGTGARP